MDILYLKNREIDRQCWDDCIDNSLNGLPYAYSWYLDIVAGKKWDAIVIDNYKAIFPLPWNRKYIIFPQVYQPFFAQQLGLFSTAKFPPNFIETVIDCIPAKYVKQHFHLNEKNDKPSLQKLRIKANFNQVLPLYSDYETIRGNYSKSLRKNLRKAADSGLQWSSSIAPSQLVNLYKTELGEKIRELRQTHYFTIESLIKEALSCGKGNIHTVTDSEGELMVSGFFLESHNRIINLFGASTAKGKETYAMHFLLDGLIAKHAGSDKIFDFEGSSIPSIATFFRSFGAQDRPYYSCEKKWTLLS